MNANGVANHFVAINDVAGITDVGTYTGNGTDNRNITGVGLSPAYVMTRLGNTSGPPEDGVHRPSSLAGDASMFFDDTANAANRVQALQADGFQLGTDVAVNENGKALLLPGREERHPEPELLEPGLADRERDRRLLREPGLGGHQLRHRRRPLRPLSERCEPPDAAQVHAADDPSRLQPEPGHAQRLLLGRRHRAHDRRLPRRRSLDRERRHLDQRPGHGRRRLQRRLRHRHPGAGT